MYLGMAHVSKTSVVYWSVCREVGARVGCGAPGSLTKPWQATSSRRPHARFLVPAGTGSQLVDQTLRLWGAATRKEFRGRGAYKALVLERCRVGMDLGATLAITKANIATSSSILKRAGFRRVGTERRHVLEV
jgi:hypothetical protein